MSLSVAGFFRMLVLPPAGFFLLLAIGWVCAQRRARLGRSIYVFSVLVAYILCTAAGADLLVTPLEDLTTPLAADAAHGARAIVVLAAGRLDNAPEYGGRHVPDYVALARLRYAARLQHATGLPLLVSGGNRADDAGRDSKAAGMARALREDFRTPVTWIEGESETTAENASMSARMLQDAGVRRVLLVTDAMHMPRAAPAFSAAGLQVTEAPTLFLRMSRHDINTFFPSAEGLRRSYYASYEWIGLLWYRLRDGDRARLKVTS